MSTTRFAILIGLLLALIWAVAGTFTLVLWAVVFGLVGWVVGLVLEGRVSVDVSNAFTSSDGQQGGGTSSSASRSTVR